MIEQNHFRTCNLCEAMCGLVIRVKGDEIISIKGDKEDPFSQGHICPKAVALQDLQNDKDRLTKPVKKTKDGWQEISWSQALKESAAQIRSIQEKYGRNALGVYLGNPNVHNVDAMIFGIDFYRQLKTKNRFSATSVDQLPHQLAAMLMFGHPMKIPVPDIDRTNFMVILGGNPVVSNGSIMTVPGVKKRLKAIQERGGQFVTIDPRLTETAQLANQHLYIRPGTDAMLLMAMVNYLFENDLVNCGHLIQHIDHLDQIADSVAGFSIELASQSTGIEAGQIRQLIEQFCQAERAVLYPRIGVSTHEFGSLVNWLTNVFNILTGNLDSEGGAMFTTPVIDITGGRKQKVKKFARFFSRVSNYPETINELPVVALAEEILTPGEGQIKGMVVAAGNPCLSTPNNNLLEQAFEKLDFRLSIDFYINETSRHADLILPPPSPLERPHYDLVFNHLAVRNVAKYSRALFKRANGSLSEAEIYLRLTFLLAPRGIISTIKAWSKMQLLKWLKAEGVISKGLTEGAYKKGNNSNKQTVTLKKLLDNPHGLDLGPLEPIFPNGILCANGKIQLAPQEFVADLARLKQKYCEPLEPSSVPAPEPEPGYPFLLIGRRDPRTCNSWMHNSYRLVKGKPACTALINTQDAEAHGIQSGQLVKVSSRVGEVFLPAQLSEGIMQGVISIPHGWGHGKPGTQLSVANDYAGVSVNQLTDEKLVDALTGNAALNGVPINVTPA